MRRSATNRVRSEPVRVVVARRAGIPRVCSAAEPAASIYRSAVIGGLRMRVRLALTARSAVVGMRWDLSDRQRDAFTATDPAAKSRVAAEISGRKPRLRCFGHCRNAASFVRQVECRRAVPHSIGWPPSPSSSIG